MWLNAPFPMLVILLVAIVGRGAQLQIQGGFAVQTIVDSAGYIYSSEGPLSVPIILSNHRTPVYPMMLRLLRVGGASLSFAPYMHYVVFALSTVVLFICLYRGGLAGWQAGVASLPLLNCSALSEHIGFVLPEISAIAFGLGSLGLTFLIAAKGGNIKLCACLAFATMLAWLTGRLRVKSLSEQD